MLRSRLSAPRPALPATRPGGPPAYPPPAGDRPPAARRSGCRAGPAYGALSPCSVRRPGRPFPLNKLAPEAALRRLELTIVRRLEGYLHGDHLGLLPGPGSETNDARLYIAGPGRRPQDRLGGHRADHRRRTSATPSPTASSRCWALLDVTPSMNWGTEGVTKRDLGHRGDRHHRLPQPEDGRPLRRLHHATGLAPPAAGPVGPVGPVRAAPQDAHGTVRPRPRDRADDAGRGGGATDPDPATARVCGSWCRTS